MVITSIQDKTNTELSASQTVAFGLGRSHTQSTWLLCEAVGCGTVAGELGQYKSGTLLLLRHTEHLSYLPSSRLVSDSAVSHLNFAEVKETFPLLARTHSIYTLAMSRTGTSYFPPLCVVEIV